MRALMFAAVVGLVGCNDAPREKPKPKANAEAHKHDHGEEGPHGGPLAEWGEEEYHAEFTVDHKAKLARVYILGPDAKTPATINAAAVQLALKKPRVVVIELKPEKEGKASVFVGTHEVLGKHEEFEGTLSAKVGDKAYAGNFAGHGHSHDK